MNTTRDDYGSGNVFEDIGIPNPDEFLVKADLASKVASVIEARGLTQLEAAHIAGVSQPKISLMMRGQLDNISTDRLCRVLNKLGVQITIVLTNSVDWEAARTTVNEPDDEDTSEVALGAQRLSLVR